MAEGDTTNKQPAMDSKKGPIQTYTKIASSADTLLTASNAFLAKIKTANESGGMIQPDEVLKLVNESILPAVQSIKEGIEGNGQPVGGDGGRGAPGDIASKPVDDGNSGGNELDSEDQRKIAKLEATVAQLTAKEREMKVAALAQRFASLFPATMQAAKEKEIKDSSQDYEALSAKVEGAEMVIKAAKDSGEFKRTSTYVGNYGQNRFAKADGSGAVVVPPWAR